MISYIAALSTINSSFSIGKDTEGRTRPLLIRFLSKHGRNEVYGKLGILKGQEKWSKISVSAELFDILSKQASDARDGLWKIIRRRANKQLEFINS